MNDTEASRRHLLHHLFAAAIREVCPGVSVEAPAAGTELREMPWAEVTVAGLRAPLWLAADPDARRLFSLETVSLTEAPVLRRFVSRVAQTAGRPMSVASAGTGTPPDTCMLFPFLVTSPDGSQVQLAMALEPELARTLSTPAEVPMPSSAVDSAGLGVLLDMQLPVSICVGRAHLSLGEALELTDGSIVALEASEDELVEIIVNRTIVARGELVVVDGNYGVRIHDLVSGQRRMDLASELSRLSQGASRV